MSQSGLLGLYNLWGFWNSIPESFRKQVIEYYENNSGFWDYKSLFEGVHIPILDRGAIDVLNTLLVLDDLNYCDLLFQKFQEFTPDNYLQKCWGEKWQQHLEYRNKMAENLRERRNGEESKTFNNQLNFINELQPYEVYWFDTHFFLTKYTSKVYHNYETSNCSIHRFIDAYEIEFNNNDHIIRSIKILSYPFDRKNINVQNGVSICNNIYGLYLSYYENMKEYKNCLSLAEIFKETGWADNYDFRIEHYRKKIG